MTSKTREPKAYIFRSKKLAIFAMNRSKAPERMLKFKDGTYGLCRPSDVAIFEKVWGAHHMTLHEIYHTDL